MTAPGDFSAGDVLTAADMNGLPAGVVAHDQLAGDVSLTTSDATIFSLSFSSVSGRLYSWWLNGFVRNFSVACELRIDVDVNGTRDVVYRQNFAASDICSPIMFGNIAGTGSTVTVVCVAQVSSGTADWDYSSTTESYITVADMGVA